MAYTFAIYSFSNPGTNYPPGTYDIGWHQFCALGYAAVMHTDVQQDSVWVVAGPDANGLLHWNAGIGYANSGMYVNCI